MARIRRALLSVHDKTGLVEFARGLAQQGIEVLSTGGTATALAQAGVACREVAEITGFPEMMDGRVKTLHPKVFGGLLCDRANKRHVAEAEKNGVPLIDLLAVNFYPFEQTASRSGVTLEEAVEQIDIGGPALVRAAAKNFRNVAVVTEPRAYPALLAALAEGEGELPEDMRLELARRAFMHTSRYEGDIFTYFTDLTDPQTEFPEVLVRRLERIRTLRYGENPHQSAAFYRDSLSRRAVSVARAEIIGGKELSFNNILDADSALNLLVEFADDPTVLIVKHGNPCGLAIHPDPAEAFERALAGDPLSAYGGVVGTNRPVEASLAEAVTGEGKFFEVMVAPDYSPDAIEILTSRRRWGRNLRVIRAGPIEKTEGLYSMRSVRGGVLIQRRDDGLWDETSLQVVTQETLEGSVKKDLPFAFMVAKHVLSNAVVLARDCQVVGVGAGQASRVDAVRIAVAKAGPRCEGAVLASDAFFPFADGPEIAIDAGVIAIVQPGGSLRDKEVIELCNARGVPMVFTGMRHFRH
ncbi:MAG: bifunctional phosphoribosylaminoimidazolecarboxamide formyltransferase/IMP cyclohydrolase [Planctomycetes bacterium]|nr:bifunctional phosphoribosylaminoimidazolecarboxamide formyltransferase/IMP cyclohydrolase [Planctomycetota bacterium]